MTRRDYDALYRHYVGIDESGRGCVGGSMFFVGVTLKDGVDPTSIEWACDSKKTKHSHRVEMAKKLREFVDYFVVETPASDIDNKGLSYCISSSLRQIQSHFNKPVIYDGNTNYKVDGIETLIKGDDKVSLIATASIFAKLLKDRNSEQLDKLYPEYGFISHSGYVNQLHTDNIIKYGYCPAHRRSYNIKKLEGIVLPERYK